MKYLSILMLVVLLASLAGVCYLYLTANISVTATGIEVTAAVDQPAAFEELQAQLRVGAVVGTPYTTVVPEEASRCKFVTYRVQLRNATLIDAEMVELQVIPRDADILQVGSSDALTLKAGDTGIFTATILTDIDAYTAR